MAADGGLADLSNSVQAVSAHMPSDLQAAAWWSIQPHGGSSSRMVVHPAGETPTAQKTPFQERVIVCGFFDKVSAMSVDHQGSVQFPTRQAQVACGCVF
jgi:hypothetical protein